MAGPDPHRELRDRLLDAELLFPTGVEGLYGRSETYQGIVNAIDSHGASVGPRARGDDGASPPGAGPRARSTRPTTSSRSPISWGRCTSFGATTVTTPSCCGAWRPTGDWPALLDPGEVVLSSAACHALYPMCIGPVARRRPALRGQRVLLPPRTERRPGSHAGLQHARGRLRGRPRRGPAPPRRGPCTRAQLAERARARRDPGPGQRPVLRSARFGAGGRSARRGAEVGGT